PLLHVPDRAQWDVGLGDLPHRDRCLHPRDDPGFFQEVLQCEAVHHRAEHAHVVGTGPVHAPLGEFGAAEEIPAADDDRYLHPFGHRAATCLATPATTSGSRPISPPPKTSPESLSNTRRGLVAVMGGAPSGFSPDISVLP